MTCGDEVIGQLDVLGVDEVDAVGGGAALRGADPEEARPGIGAAGEGQVLLLAVLHGHALHPDPVAFLEMECLHTYGKPTTRKREIYGFRCELPMCNGEPAIHPTVNVTED